MSFSFFIIAGNGDGMLRAALETAFLSAVTNLIGIVNLSRCTSLPPEIYRMLWPGFIFHSYFKYKHVFNLCILAISLCESDYNDRIESSNTGIVSINEGIF